MLATAFQTHRPDVRRRGARNSVHRCVRSARAAPIRSVVTEGQSCARRTIADRPNVRGGRAPDSGQGRRRKAAARNGMRRPGTSIVVPNSRAISDYPYIGGRRSPNAAKKFSGSARDS